MRLAVDAINGKDIRQQGLCFCKSLSSQNRDMLGIVVRDWRLMTASNEKRRACTCGTKVAAEG